MIRVVFFLCLTLTIVAACLLRKRRYLFSLGISFAVAAAIIIGGIGGTYILGYVESGSWGAISYYGSVFAIPILMLPLARLFGVRYLQLMDYCTSSGCIAITVGKLFCKIQGCCGGRVIGYHSNGMEIIFPSQIVEMLYGLVLLAVFLFLEKKQKLRSIFYPLFLILYGGGRFILNYFRETKSWLGALPTGNVWSIVAILIGCFWLFNVKIFLLNRSE